MQGTGEQKEKAVELSSPSAIYDAISQQLTKVIDSTSADSSAPELKDVSQKTRSQLQELQHSLENQLSELQSNAEWDTFTIAFYGETGAGKSTLIETLRILLEEPTKKATQKVFEATYSSYVDAQSALTHLQQDLEESTLKLHKLEEQLKAIDDNHEKSRRELEVEYQEIEAPILSELEKLGTSLESKEQVVRELSQKEQQLTSAVHNKRQQASLWQKLILLFKKLPEEVELTSLQNQLTEATQQVEATRQQFNAQQSKNEHIQQERAKKLDGLQRKTRDAKSELLSQKAAIEAQQRAFFDEEQQLEASLEEKHAELVNSADGEIIGNGQPDFTKQTQRYDFTVNGQPFALLDVPGIEGKEGQVVHEIEKAVQTAHAVFYVTNKPAPPQTGDNERKGTLEKIKLHLGAQTEVWTVFNKKVTNPKYTLKNRPLLSDDEKASLLTLEDTMREHLGSHFQSAISLSALPAFLASTDCLEPNSENEKRREKCLQAFSESELIDASKIHAFIDKLKLELLPNSQAKIQQSNFYKAKLAVDNTTDALDVLSDTFSTLTDELNSTQNSSQHQLKTSFSALQKRLHSRGESMLQRFSRRARQSTYEAIEKDISNDAFKQALKAAIKTEQDVLNQKLPDAMEHEIKRFQEDVADILKRFEEQTQELSNISEQLSSSKLDEKLNLKIKIDNGINVTGLVASVIGGLVSAPFTGGAGLYFVIASAAGVVVSVAKAVASFFSSSYKMSQQRKSTDENLHKVMDQLKQSLTENLDNAIPEMKSIVEDLDKALENPTKQAKRRHQMIQQASVRLKTLSNQVNALGVI